MVRKASPAPAASISPAQTSRRRSSISGLPAFQAPVEATPTNAAATIAADVAPSSSPSTPVYLPIESLSSEALFNRLGGFGSLLVLDLRSAEEYKASHVPRSLNLPMTEGDLVEVNAEEVAGALTSLEQRLHLTDQRAFRMRQRCTIVLVGHPAEDASAAESSFSPSFSLTPLLSLAHSRLSLHLARLLTLEGKVASVCSVTGGFTAFHSVYPFVCCAYSQRELASGKHIHRKPFPWYPCEILISPAVQPREDDMRIYLGSKVDAANREHLSHLRVTHILNCTEEVPNTFENDAEGATIIYKRLNLCDEVTVRITDVFSDAFSFLDSVASTPGGGRVLVHCAEGISRSATVVIAFLMRTYGLTLYQAYSHAKSQRKQVFPNLGFWKQLDALEKELWQAKPEPKGEYRSTMADCIDMNLLMEEYKARKAMAEGGGGDNGSSSTSDPSSSTSTIILTPPPGASPNGTWKLAGVASADAKQRNEEAIVEEAQCPIGPIITAE